jgi:hypothetical protein
MKTGSEGIVTLLKDSFKETQGLTEIPLRIIIQLHHAVINSF